MFRYIIYKDSGFAAKNYLDNVFTLTYDVLYMGTVSVTTQMYVHISFSHCCFAS